MTATTNTHKFAALLIMVTAHYASADCDADFHSELTSAVGSKEKCAAAFKLIRCAAAVGDQDGIAAAASSMRVLRATEKCPEEEAVVAQVNEKL